MKKAKVFCWGTFDRLHQGHLKFLKDVKNKGDKLFVIVIADSTVIENKSKKPVQTQEQRIKAIKDSGLADEVIAVSEDLNANFEKIACLKPDVFVFGYDQQTKIEEKLKEFLRKKKVKTKFVVSKEFANGIHTSNLLK